MITDNFWFDEVHKKYVYSASQVAHDNAKYIHSNPR